ncbi:MAG TPA: Ig-like domain-containing protein [Candidatus Caccomonas pullistercoris]|nr:Ig-like domain-containing protein [Candidatus Caccomonas pullistercoris]
MKLTVGEGELGWASSHTAEQFEKKVSGNYEPRGVQFGTGSNPIGEFTLTANESLNGVTSVTIVASASGAGNTIAVKVGDTNFNGEVTEIASGTANANKEYTFTGEATNGVITITINDKAKAVWVKSISVKNEDVVPGKEAAGLSFGEVTKFTADLGSTFTAPTLTKTTDAAATYTSSETSVATVDASTGDVTLVGAGTTTITATTPETDAYMAGSASYTLTVTDLASMPKFQKATTITSGKRYLIVVDVEGELLVAQPVASGKGFDFLQVTSPAQTDAEGLLYMENLDNAFTLTAVEGGYYIQQADGRYLYKSGNYDNFNVGNEAGDNAVWTIEPQADGTFLITNVSVNKYVQFDPNYNSFGSYANDRGTLPVLYEEVGGKEAPEFSFAAQTATLNLLDAGAFTAPALTNTSDGAVTYTSSDDAVATIDAEGRIEALAVGTTTITASVAETDEFTTATAEFTLHVTTLSDYMKTTTVESGKTYILAADNEGTAVIAQTVAANSRYDYLPVNEAAPADLMGATDLLNGFTLTETEGGYTIQDAYGRYLYMDETHTSFNVSADRQDGDTWTVEPQADGTVKITNVLREKFIQYSTEHESYGAYTDEQGIKPSLYVKNSIEVNEDGYATAYSDNAVILPEGLQAAVITGVADGKLTIDYRYNSGDVIPAGTAVLVKGEAGAHDYNLATSDEQAVAGNLLKGAASDVATEGDGCLFYMLSYDANHQNLGFYWAAKDGAAFTSKAGKAYLALPQAASAGVTGYALDGAPVGIDQATTDAQTPVAIYTVDGRRVQQTDANDLPKGLYIVNGKKVIIK